MASIPARILKFYARKVIRYDPPDGKALVKHLRKKLNHSPLPVFLPRGVHKQSYSAGEVNGDWLSVKEPRQAVLYLHGGGYVAGVNRTYLSLCGHVAKKLQADVYLPDYRLAPEHPFPAAVEDAMASYKHLLSRFTPSQITLMGDSAGGGLALGTLLAIRDAGMEAPRCAVAFSPYADMTQEQPSRKDNEATDDFFTANTFFKGRELYATTEEHRRHPHASPVFGDFTGLPPLMMTVDENECLRDDTYRVLDKAREANVPVELISREGMMHVWPIFYPLISEARKDVAKALRFIQQAGN